VARRCAPASGVLRNCASGEDHVLKVGALHRTADRLSERLEYYGCSSEGVQILTSSLPKRFVYGGSPDGVTR